MKSLKQILFHVFFCLPFFLYSQKAVNAAEKNITNIAVSDTGAVAYSYYEEKDGMFSTVKEYFVKYNGKVLGPYENVKDIYFADDGKTIFYQAKKQDGIYVCTDKTEKGVFKNYGEVFKSGKNGAAGYIIKHNCRSGVIDGEDESEFSFCDGIKTFGPYKEPIKPCITKDGKILYLANEGFEKYYIMHGGNKSERFYNASSEQTESGISLFRVRGYDTDKKRNMEYEIWVDGKKTGQNASNIIFSPLRKNYAYTATVKGKKSVYTAAGEFGAYKDNDKIDILKVTENKVLYSLHKGNEYHFYSNGKTLGRFPNKNVIFSDDGKKSAYIKDGHIISGNEKIGIFRGISNLNFMPDNKTLVYTAGIEDADGIVRLYLCVGKEKIGPFETVDNIIFSDDGKRIAYIADGYVFNGREKTKKYGDLDGFMFLPNGNLFYFVRIKNYEHETTGINVHNGSNVFEIPLRNMIYSSIVHFEILKDGYPFFVINQGAGAYSEYAVYRGNKQIGIFMDMSDIQLLKNEKPVFVYTTYEDGMFLNFGDIKSGSHNNIDYGYQISEDETCVSFRADSSKNILLKDGKEYLGALSNDGKTKAWLDGGKIFIN